MSDQNDGPVVVSLHVEGWNNSADDTVEVPRAEWLRMTPAQRQEWCEGAANVHASNTVSWGWYIDDPADLASTEEP